jgi:hypothetical protein
LAGCCECGVEPSGAATMELVLVPIITVNGGALVATVYSFRVCFDFSPNGISVN